MIISEMRIEGERLPAAAVVQDVLNMARSIRYCLLDLPILSRVLDVDTGVNPCVLKRSTRMWRSERGQGSVCALQ